ncbi:hypothetical protein NHL51_05215 [Leucobacter sp. gxy201]|uniref:hypothetical protein n=1 Tax=Leucobacter sp. gxy201 TaxID=2957200 RepID=UPI003DA12D83
MNDAAIDELTRNMMALDAGLHRITETFGEHVQLRDEDPVVFGAGHYVLYPVEGSTVRLSITEQYAGTDWSDDERVPTSWSWEAEARVTQPGHGHPWVTLAEGEVASADYARLLNIAEGWAGAIHALAEREVSLSPEAVEQSSVAQEFEGRTFLT